MQVIPIIAAASQTLSVLIGEQQCDIFIRVIGERLYFDLSISGAAISQTILCHNRCALVSRAYTGFRGNLFFMDTLGDDEPQVSGLGDRWLLCYIGADE